MGWPPARPLCHGIWAKYNWAAHFLLQWMEKQRPFLHGRICPVLTFLHRPQMRMLQSSLVAQLQFLGVSRFSQVYHSIFCFTFVLSFFFKKWFMYVYFWLSCRSLCLSSEMEALLSLFGVAKRYSLRSLCCFSSQAQAPGTHGLVAAVSGLWELFGTPGSMDWCIGLVAP